MVIQTYIIITTKRMSDSSSTNESQINNHTNHKYIEKLVKYTAYTNYYTNNHNTQTETKPC